MPDARSMFRPRQVQPPTLPGMPGNTPGSNTGNGGYSSNEAARVAPRSLRPATVNGPWGDTTVGNTGFNEWQRRQKPPLVPSPQRAIGQTLELPGSMTHQPTPLPLTTPGFNGSNIGELTERLTHPAGQQTVQFSAPPERGGNDLAGYMASVSAGNPFFSKAGEAPPSSGVIPHPASYGQAVNLAAPVSQNPNTATQDEYMARARQAAPQFFSAPAKSTSFTPEADQQRAAIAARIAAASSPGSSPMQWQHGMPPAPSASQPATAGGVRPEFQAELDRVLAASPAASGGPQLIPINGGSRWSSQDPRWPAQDMLSPQQGLAVGDRRMSSLNNTLDELAKVRAGTSTQPTELPENDQFRMGIHPTQIGHQQTVAAENMSARNRSAYNSMGQPGGYLNAIPRALVRNEDGTINRQASAAADTADLMKAGTLQNQRNNYNNFSQQQMKLGGAKPEAAQAPAALPTLDKSSRFYHQEGGMRTSDGGAHINTPTGGAMLMGPVAFQAMREQGFTPSEIRRGLEDPRSAAADSLRRLTSHAENVRASERTAAGGGLSKAGQYAQRNKDLMALRYADSPLAKKSPVVALAQKRETQRQADEMEKRALAGGGTPSVYAAKPSDSISQRFAKAKQFEGSDDIGKMLAAHGTDIKKVKAAIETMAPTMKMQDRSAIQNWLAYKGVTDPANFHPESGHLEEINAMLSPQKKGGTQQSVASSTPSPAAQPSPPAGPAAMFPQITIGNTGRHGRAAMFPWWASK